MLKIKLARFGKRNQPHYRLVINTDREKRDGKYIAQVGHYAPAQIPKILEIDVKEFKAWVTKGAQPTETVAALFKRYQSKNPFPPKKNQLSRKAKAKLAKPKEAAPAAVPAPKAEEPAEAPTVEAPAEKPAETSAPAEPAPAKPTPAAEEKPAEPETKPAADTPVKS